MYVFFLQIFKHLENALRRHTVGQQLVQALPHLVQSVGRLLCQNQGGCLRHEHLPVGQGDGLGVAEGVAVENCDV